MDPSDMEIEAGLEEIRRTVEGFANELKYYAPYGADTARNLQLFHDRMKLAVAGGDWPDDLDYSKDPLYQPAAWNLSTPTSADDELDNDEDIEEAAATLGDTTYAAFNELRSCPYIIVLRAAKIHGWLPEVQPDERLEGLEGALQRVCRHDTGSHSDHSSLLEEVYGCPECDEMQEIATDAIKRFGKQRKK